MASLLTVKENLELLSRCLLTHNENCIELSSVLTLEQESIIQNNAEELLKLLEKKQVLISEVEGMQIQINKIVEEQLELELTTQSVMRFLKSNQTKHDELSSGVQLLWGQFMEQAQIIEQKNLVNGHLLNKQNAKNQLLIALLRGQKPSSSLYGQNGKSSRPTYSAHLGQA